VISTAIYSILYADSNIQGQVSNRIYPNRAVQGAAMPYLVYSIVSKLPTDSKDDGVGFDKHRIQIDVIDDNYTNVELIASYLRTALDRVTGVYDETEILQTVYDDEVDVFEDLQENSEQIYHKAVDFMIIAKDASFAETTEMTFAKISRALNLGLPAPDSPYWFIINGASQSYGVWFYFGGYAEPSDISACDVKIQVDNAYDQVGMGYDSTGVQQATAIADTLNADATFTGFDTITRDGAELTFTVSADGDVDNASKDEDWSELTITVTQEGV